MNGLFIAAHGQFAQGLMSAAKMIWGDVSHCRSFGLEEEGDIEAFRRVFVPALEDALKSYDKVLVLCDIIGGTPYNIALRVALSYPERLYICGGANLTMVVEALSAQAGPLDARKIEDFLGDTRRAVRLDYQKIHHKEHQESL